MHTVSPLLAGVDIGTSGVKVGLFDPAGRLVGLGRAPYKVSIPHPGWVEVDPEAWWQGLIAALSQACAAGDVPPTQIGALGISAVFPTVAPLDVQGRALTPALLYNDQRSLEQVRAITAICPRSQYEARIGNRLMPGTCAVTSMAWLRDEQPDAYRAAHILGFANTCVVARLTGEFFTDPTNAALSGLTDIRDPWQWSESLCRDLGIALEKLPPIAGPAHVAGTLTTAAAQATGLRAGIPVVVGAGDVPTAAVGAGATLGGPAIYSAGSTDCVALLLPAPAEGLAWVNSGYATPETWLAIGTVTSSGMSVEWFAETFLGGRDRETLARMTRLAAASPPGSRGLLYLPYLQGERTPIWDAQARGVFAGLTTATTLGDLARAVFEGVALALRHVVTHADAIARRPVAEIRAMGGGTQNALWNQLKADVLQRPLHILSFQETGALGAALLAGVGCGVYRSLEETVAVAAEVIQAQAILPDAQQAARYDDLFDLYTQLYPQTQAIAHRLGSLAT